jgi:hypothetical protein
MRSILTNPRLMLVALIISLFIFLRTATGVALSPSIQSTPNPTATIAAPTPTATPTPNIKPEFLSSEWWEEFFRALAEAPAWAEISIGIAAGAITSVLLSLISSIISRSRKDLMEFRIGTEIVRLDDNTDTYEKMRLLTQTLSAEKLKKGDTTGWYELREDVRFGEGLHPTVRSILEKELKRMQQERGGSEVQSEYETRLQSLLRPDGAK